MALYTKKLIMSTFQEKSLRRGLKDLDFKGQINLNLMR